MNKWTTTIFLVSIARGVAFPDYRHDLSVVVIPFLLSLICGVLATLSVLNAKTNWSKIIPIGLSAIFLSDVLGTIIYGYSSGWHYVTEDTETQAVLIATTSIQTIIFLASLLVGWFYQKRSNKKMKADGK